MTHQPCHYHKNCLPSPIWREHIDYADAFDRLAFEHLQGGNRHQRIRRLMEALLIVWRRHQAAIEAAPNRGELWAELAQAHLERVDAIREGWSDEDREHRLGHREYGLEKRS